MSPCRRKRSLHDSLARASGYQAPPRPRSRVGLGGPNGHSAIESMNTSWRVEEAAKEHRIEATAQANFAGGFDHGNAGAEALDELGIGVDVAHRHAKTVAPPPALELGPGILAEVAAGAR